MTADPFFLFVTKQHREALVGLTYAVLDRKGFLVLSGMAGSGKTTLLSWVLQRLSCDNLRSSVILNPTLTREEFLEMMMLDFGITEIPPSKAQRLWVLQNFLLAGAKEGKVNVLIVDEAHKLSYELLEEIRFLGNLEYGQEKLLQILLLGQSELDDILNRPELWQLKQRISVRLSIGSLAPNEVEHYIQHRWTLAGGQQHPFSAESIEHIRRWSNGVPRLINALCDNSLTQAFADESRTVTSTHVDAAAEDLLLKEKPRSPHKAIAVGIAAAAAPAPHVDHSPPVPPLRPVLVAAPAVSSQVAPVNGISVVALQNPAPKPRRRSVFSRWAEKLGLNGYGRI